MTTTTTTPTCARCGTESAKPNVGCYGHGTTTVRAPQPLTGLTATERSALRDYRQGRDVLSTELVMRIVATIDGLELALRCEKENHGKTLARCEALSGQVSTAHEAAMVERDLIVAWLRTYPIIDGRFTNRSYVDLYADEIERAGHR